MKVISSLSALLILSGFASAAVIERPGLVDAIWLRSNLVQPSLRVIDARDLKSYLAGHIPGAVYLNVETLRSSDQGVPARLFPNPQLSLIFSGLGIDSGTDVVVYSSSADDFASSTYIATILEALGHNRVVVLNGGYERWVAGGGATDDGLPAVSRLRFVADRNLHNVVTADEVQSQAQNINLFDARPTDVYTKGHLPNAKSLPLKTMLTDGPNPVWKGTDALREELRKAGYDLTRPTVTYCTTGREASMLYFTIRHVLGIPNTQVYAGSFLDWRSRNLPVEK